MSRFYAFIFVFSFSLIYLNAQSTDGFWGLKYGMTKAQVEAANINATIVEKNKDSFYLENISFGGADFDYGSLSFYKNQLYSGYFLAELSIDEGAALALKLSKILIDKYGLPLVSETEGEFLWNTENKNAVILIFKVRNDKPTVTLLYSCEKIRLQKEKDQTNDF